MKPLLGRLFNENDVLISQRVAIIDKLLADKYWPGKDPLGKRIVRDDPAKPFLVVGVVCTAWAIGYETITLDGLREALVPILYTGVISVGFAYTGQVVAQRYAGAADAAIILSSETLFAALFGYLMMGDRLNAAGVAGCVLIFVCIIAVQLAPLVGARVQADGARG